MGCGCENALFPTRVLVVGPPGAGKSTVAQAIGRRLGVDSVKTDDLRWEAGWKRRPCDEVKAAIRHALASNPCIIDGGFTCFDAEMLTLLDLVVYIDMSFSCCAFNLLKRSLWRMLRQEPCCNGNRESAASLFNGRSGLLWKCVGKHLRYRDLYVRLLWSVPHVRLTSRNELRTWLDSTFGAHCHSLAVRPDDRLPTRSSLRGGAGLSGTPDHCTAATFAAERPIRSTSKEHHDASRPRRRARNAG